MPNNVTEEQVFDAYINQMMADKGVLEENKQQSGKIEADLRAQLDEAIQRAVVDELPEEKLLALDQMLDGDVSDEELGRFFDEAGIDYAAVVGGVMYDFREAYLGGREQAARPVNPSDQMAGNNAQPVNMTMEQTTISAEVPAPAGNPVQGAVSEVPGVSNVEGVADMGANMQNMEGGNQ